MLQVVTTIASCELTSIHHLRKISGGHRSSVHECEINLVALAFLCDVEGNFVCPAFWKFWCNVIHCKSTYKKTDSTVICVTDSLKVN